MRLSIKTILKTLYQSIIEQRLPMALQSLKNMKNASKGNGPDIASLMKTMLEGKPPVF